MSLDIDLYSPVPYPCECICESCGNKHEKLERNHLVHFNLTHNLGKMAAEADLYKCLWRPDENGIKLASQMIPLLRKGLTKLIEDPERFEAYNPTNNYGSYEWLVRVVSELLEACEKNPEAIIEVCR